MQLVTANIAAINSHFAGHRIVEPRHQAGDRCLAGARWSNQRGDGARFDLKVQTLKDQSIARVTKPQILKLDRTGKMRRFFRAGQVADFALGFEDFANAFVADDGLRNRVRHL